ncbi:hypothetical protein QOZ80_1BG0056130 [Eleusine coracana subsp. coracana]|nr:hypothetical protein QOZ80_1BG0056130 [Eleusine coracana subsp. coracana]
MGGGIASIWEQWNIQILVILSFALQVILLFCAGIRRREASALLTIPLWLAYLMADYTAIYALGHMSISISKSEHPHQMVPFWAPFLLLHLGGPDTITAYAFQDNQLWLRHLLTLAAQVLGAAYVMYLFLTDGKKPVGTLIAAAALMFFTGCLKYGERTWALKCGGIDSIASSLPDGIPPATRGRGPYHGRKGEKRLDSEEVLLGAHYMLNVCKGLVADGPVMQASEYEAVRQGIQLNGNKYIFELAAMELSLLYDIMYTKAAVIHTWHGIFIRMVSPLSAVAAFVLFQLSSKHGYDRVDVAVSYVLLAGAMALELTSSLGAAGSSWACASYHARGWDRVCNTVMCLRRKLKAGASRNACLDKLGQYNLLDLCTDPNKDSHVRGKIAKKIGLGDRWQKAHYSSTAPITDGIKDLVLREIRKRKIDDLRNARGSWILKEKQMFEDLMRITDDTELDRSIMVWHIATDLYLSMCPESDNKEMQDNIRVLSNHMLFLMVVHPYLLPGVVRSSRYKENLRYYDMVWWTNLKSTKEGTKKLSRSEIVKKIAEWQLPANWMPMYTYGIGEEAADDADDRPVYADGCWLAGMLLGNRWHLTVADMLDVIAGVWVEMMCYASHHCGQESHAKKLSTGGEFMNLVWLIIGQATMYDRFAPSAEGLTGGLGFSKPVRRPKLPARWMKPEVEQQSTIGVQRRGVPLPPGVHPAYRPFFDVEANQTPSTSSAERHNQ